MEGATPPTSFSWQAMPRPIFALAPMEDVTDTVYRRLIRGWSHRVSHGRSGGPAVMFTEFTRVDRVVRTADGGGQDPRLEYTGEERPLIAQVWGTRPEEYRTAAAAVQSLGFDGIDLNMGCPAKKIRAVGACSALIENPTLAGEIIAACREGTDLPLSVKTRIGVTERRTEAWAGYVLEQGIDALTIHPRTADQMSEGTVHWDEFSRVLSLRDAIAPETVVLGNGDVSTLQDAETLTKKTGADGIMIGRGIFADPFLFARLRVPELPPWDTFSLEHRLHHLVEHITAYADYWGNRRSYEVLKKFFRNYVIPTTAEENDLLDRLYATHRPSEALALLDREPR